MPSSLPPPRKRIASSTRVSVTGARGRRVALVIDDDPLVRALLARALVRDGFDVRTSIGALGASEELRLAVVGVREDVAGDGLCFVLGALLEAHPEAALLLRAADPAAAAERATAIGLGISDVCPASAAVEDVVALVRRITDDADSIDVVFEDARAE
jgi:ActR/RegA family two-component response regulator